MGVLSGSFPEGELRGAAASRCMAASKSCKCGTKRHRLERARAEPRARPATPVELTRGCCSGRGSCPARMSAVRSRRLSALARVSPSSTCSAPIRRTESRSWRWAREAPGRAPRFWVLKTSGLILPRFDGHPCSAFGPGKLMMEPRSKFDEISFGTRSGEVRPGLTFRIVHGLDQVDAVL